MPITRTPLTVQDFVPNKVPHIYSNNVIGQTETKEGSPKKKPQGPRNGLAWSLQAVDKSITFTSQFPPKDFAIAHELSGTWEEIKTYGTQHPLFHFVNGNTETFKVDGMMVSTSATSINEGLETLKQFVRMNTQTGSPPVAFFNYGSIRIQCFVENMTIDKAYIMPNGVTRIVEFSLKLKRFIETKRTNNAPFSKTFKFWKSEVMKIGETFEMLSKRIYGTPKYGDLLRKMYPGVEPVTKPTKIDLPTAEWCAANNSDIRSPVFKRNGKTGTKVQQTKNKVGNVDVDLSTEFNKFWLQWWEDKDLPKEYLKNNPDERRFVVTEGTGIKSPLKSKKQ